MEAVLMGRVEFVLAAVLASIVVIQPAFALTAVQKGSAYTSCRKNGTSPQTCCSIAGGKWEKDIYGNVGCTFTDDRRVPGQGGLIGSKIIAPSR
jgi:roadblock/LC7 domain-containing protein